MCWFWPPLILRATLITQKKFVLFIRFMVLKTTGLSSGFQRKNRVSKYGTGPEILAKMSKKNAHFGRFWLISRDPMHIFLNQCLLGNSELKPGVLSTMNLINRIFLFWVIKGFQYQKGPGPALPILRLIWCFFLWSHIQKCKQKKQKQKCATLK